MASSSSSSASYNVAYEQDSSSSSTFMDAKILIITVVVLVLVVTLIAALHLYARWVWINSAYAQWDWGWGYSAEGHHHEANQFPAGLDKRILDALPTFLYNKESRNEAMECSVCLSEFQENETGRLLPKCNHCFHTACIDMWFQTHSTCPLCRTTVGDESISHEASSVDLSYVLDVAEKQCGSDGLLKNDAFGKQETSSASSEHQNQQDHLTILKEKGKPSTHYPVNTLFYGNQNHVSWHTTSRAERFKRLEHLVIEIPSKPAALNASNSAPQSTPRTPTSHESEPSLAHLKAIKRMLSWRSTAPSTPAARTTNFHQTMLTP